MPPSVFVSHGPPTMVVDDVPVRGFLGDLGRRLDRPTAVLCVSAHWDTAAPRLGGADRPETIHDFYGFPAELYRLRYPAPGAPEVAARALALLRDAGIDAGLDPARGLDHGAWEPLMLMYPEADVPVTQVSIQSAAGAAAHLALGRTLAPLRRDGVLVLASGTAVHNLARFRDDQDSVADWARRFDDWLASRVEAGAVDDLVHYREQAPDATMAHPTEDHFLPFLVALGAGGSGARGRALHRSFAYGSLSMAAYAFEAG
ncbi:MAG: DODA-type extradiol aromatic ring-opening family dioxygenase [Kiloniellales bacterium]